MKSVLFASLLLTAAPALSSELTPLQIFVANRASSICVVRLGLVPMEEAVKTDVKKAQEMGLTQQQYLNFNSASGNNQWVGLQVEDLIQRMGGCQKVWGDIQRRKQSKGSTYQL